VPDDPVVSDPAVADEEISLLDVLPDDVEAAAAEHAVLATPLGKPAPVDGPPLLEVSDLRTWFGTRSGDVHAVDGVDLTVGRGEVLGLVGESGSGKSVTMLSVLRLVERPGRIVSGRVTFDGTDLTSLGRKQLQAIRGNRISMIFQQPNASLHPCFNAARQISEVYEIHRNSRRAAGTEKAVEMLRTVGIPDPKRRAKSFPHQLSGGQAQRVMIAMALAAEPELLIADEPTTALDVTIQAQILDLMRTLQADRGTSVVLITHDLGVVAEMAHRVAVMYGGQIVEQSPVAELFADPKHPYTVGLLGSVPVIGRRTEELTVIKGRVPTLIDPKPGCRFADRCPMRMDRCDKATPALVEIEPGRQVRCFLHSDAALEDVAVPVTVGDAT
jgi:peptide/nickel transport system ATP-binding protein